MNAIGLEAWAQMGKVMQECIKKIGEKLNCDDYMISMTIGKKAAEMFEIEKYGIKFVLRSC